MNDSEVRKLIALNIANYPQSFANLDQRKTDLLVATWLKELQDFPAETIFAAFGRALRKCRFPVTLADIFAEMQDVKQAISPDVESCWRELCKVADKCAEASSRFDYTGASLLYKGMTQGQEARYICRYRLTHMMPENMAFVGNVGRLIEIGKMDSAQREQFFFPRYRDFIKRYRANEKALSADGLGLLEAKTKMIPQEVEND